MGLEKLGKEESPDPVVERVEQADGECLAIDRQLAEPGLEKERGCDQVQQWGCFAVTEE